MRLAICEGCGKTLYYPDGRTRCRRCQFHGTPDHMKGLADLIFLGLLAPASPRLIAVRLVALAAVGAAAYFVATSLLTLIPS
jgi:hypothetical protein